MAIQFSRWRLEPFRLHRLEALREYVGAHYSWSGSPQRVPLNLLKLAIEIYLRQLVSKAPAAMVDAKDSEIKSVALDFESWCADAAVHMRLQEQLRLWVLNALFSLGIMKVGECAAGSLEIQGTTYHYGQPFAECVDLDDWVHDITAKRYDQVQFAGNRYRVPLQEAQENPTFDKDEREKLTPQTRYAYNERGDPRVTTLSQSSMMLYDEYQDHVELWDVWLPKEKKVLVMPYQESVEGGFSGVKPLKVIDWQGHEFGPFITLAYSDVPNNVMPVAPVSSLMDMHLMANQMMRKLMRTIERRKKIVAFRGQATDDQDRINRTNDGEAVRVDFPESIKEIVMNEVDQMQLLALTDVRQTFSWLAGNLETMGGLSPQATTATQEELLKNSSSTLINEMQDRTVQATKEVYRAIFKAWWQNPVMTLDGHRNVAGIDLPYQLPPQLRQIPFEKLNFTIDPYSMQSETPKSRLQGMLEILGQTVLPALPAIQQQGGNLKWQSVFESIDRYGNMPDLKDWFEWGPPPQMQGPMQLAQQATQGAPQGQNPPMPAVTRRENVRINRPTTTPTGQQHVLKQLLARGVSQNGAGR